MKRRRKAVLAFCACACAGALIFFALNSAYPLPPPKPYSLLIEDRSGGFLQAFLAEDEIWRIRTSPDEIPLKLKRILITKEDKFFYYHPGVNPFSLLRALAQNIMTGKRVSGASTITMQVARMLEPKERTYAGKLVEIFRAFQLELRYSKNEILEMYLSMVPLGGNIEGLASASLMYYQTPLERLNIAQLFDLILIPNDPNDLRPDRFPERLLAERTRKARLLLASGVFTQKDSAILWETPARARRVQLPKHAPHFALRVRETFPRATSIRTSLDAGIQQTVETLLAQQMREWKRKGVENGAVLVVENRTREVLAYAGSADFDDAATHGQVDAVKALRSPGSTLKPFLYAMEMDNGTLTPKTRLLDTPYDAEGFFAENYSGTYSGLVYADEALRRSLNVPMIRLLRESGVGEFLTFLDAAGFSSLRAQRERLGLSLILGGCGVTLEELVAGYAAFPNGGAYLPLRYTKSISPQSASQALTSGAAYMVTNILAGIDRPDLPNNFESALNLPRVAFKTGTSYGRRDAWAIGYSAEYTIGVWIGNVTHTGNPELTGSTAAAPLLVSVFNTISTRREKTILPMPRDVLVRDVCANSGLAPTRRCTHLIEEYYSVSRTLNRFCEFDKEYLVATDGATHYCPSCLGAHGYRVRTYQDYPPELLTLWASLKQPFARIPPHDPSCTRSFSGDGPKITSPSDRTTYYLVSAGQKIALKASSGLDVAEHVWYLDDRFVKRQKASDKLFVSLNDGEHTVSCMDDKGRLSTVKITVKVVM